jgi:hypothetical protein
MQSPIFVTNSWRSGTIPCWEDLEQRYKYLRRGRSSEDVKSPGAGFRLPDQVIQVQYNLSFPRGTSEFHFILPRANESHFYFIFHFISALSIFTSQSGKFPTNLFVPLPYHHIFPRSRAKHKITWRSSL